MCPVPPILSPRRVTGADESRKVKRKNRKNGRGEMEGKPAPYRSKSAYSLLYANVQKNYPPCQKMATNKASKSPRAPPYSNVRFSSTTLLRTPTSYLLISGKSSSFECVKASSLSRKPQILSIPLSSGNPHVPTQIRPSVNGPIGVAP